MITIKHIAYVITLLWVSFFCPETHAQYGLGFSGREVFQDERTSLALNTDQDFAYKDSFDLSFDLSFFPKANYFGYIVRIIVNDTQNIDLLYDNTVQTDHYFKVTRGDALSHISFDIRPAQLFNNWTRICIHYDAVKEQLSLSRAGQSWAENVKIPKNGHLKVFFGANDYSRFKTTDLPGMKLRRLKVVLDGNKDYSWPLDEDDGLIINDVDQKWTATVTNPLWIKKQHKEWQLVQTISNHGEASLAFDAKNERVYLVGTDSLLCYDVARRSKTSYAYRSGTLHLINGNQSVYDTSSNRLINFCADQQIVSVFNFDTRSWSRDFQYPPLGTNYRHLNKFFHSADSSIYFFGGYGQYRFKNDVQKYHFTTNTWTKLAPGGDFFTPRYLAALGVTRKGAYILGGYGSISGKQLVNPKNLYDLLFYDIKSNTFSKQYELKADSEDIAFANSLIIDEASHSYYGLIFPKNKFHSYLQLVKGDLSHNTFQRLGGQIPYRFHDMHAFSDLYYCKASRRFIAVSSFIEENEVTTASIYSLDDPPLPPTEENKAPSAASPFGKYLLVIGTGLLVGLLVLLFKRKKLGTHIHLSETITEDSTVPTVIQPEEPPVIKNAVFLFGSELQLLDRDGNDITRQLSPLLKELFLLILLYTFRWEKGISSEKLTELLWPDKTVDSARNNRSVNIAKLKTVLEKLDGCSLSKETGLWKFHADQRVYIDYKKYLEIVHDKAFLDRQKIVDLSIIVKRGAFLSQADYEWLDAVKAKVSNEVIHTYTHFASTAGADEHPEFMVELANYIFYFDPVNEEAMMIQCRALATLGNHTLATQAFENFRKEYEHIYGEKFKMDFREVISTI